MSAGDLLQRLGNPEDNFVERKPDGVSSAELRQTFVAFANSVPDGRTALLFIGVHDKSGQVLGVRNADELQKRVREACESVCYPPIRYSAEVLEIGGKPVLAVVVPASSNKPHFAGPSYVRVGSESPKASKEQLDELILSRTDKSRALLRLKHESVVVSVYGIDYKLGSGRPLHGSHRERRDCRVIDVQPRFVTLFDISQDQRFSELLTNVDISHDHERNRPALLVTFPSR